MSPFPIGVQKPLSVDRLPLIFPAAHSQSGELAALVVDDVEIPHTFCILDDDWVVVAARVTSGLSARAWGGWSAPSPEVMSKRA